MSREAHSESVAAATAMVEQLESLVLAAKEKLDDTLGAIILATGGGESSSESGRNAFEFMASMDDRFAELLRITDNSKAELDRYLNGF